MVKKNLLGTAEKLFDFKQQQLMIMKMACWNKLIMMLLMMILLKNIETKSNFDVSV